MKEFLMSNKNCTNEPLKVFHAAKWYYPFVGGIETAAREINGALVGKTQTEVLVCSEEGRSKTDITDGVKVVRAKTICSLLSTPISFEYLRKFRKMSKNADVIQMHAPYPLSDLALFLCAGRKKAKVALWWHSDVVKQKKMMFFYKPLMKYMLKRADVIFVSGKSIAKKSDYLPKYMNKIKVLPFGIDPKNYSVPERTGYLDEILTDKGSVKLLFAGRLVYYKGVDVLIDAMNKVSGAELFIVGEGELEAELKNKTAELGLESKIHFLGKIDDDALRGVFCDCDMFVLPSVSRSECFALVQLEAMMYGKPVINTNLPTAVPDVSLDGETGITVEPGSSEELANAIQKLTDDENLRSLYGENAKKRCITEFSLSKMQEEYYNVISSL